MVSSTCLHMYKHHDTFHRYTLKGIHCSLGRTTSDNPPFKTNHTGYICVASEKNKKHPKRTTHNIVITQRLVYITDTEQFRLNEKKCPYKSIPIRFHHHSFSPTMHYTDRALRLNLCIFFFFVEEGWVLSGCISCCSEGNYAAISGNE